MQNAEINIQKVNPNISKLKLSQVNYIAYACGDFASNLCWTFVGTYLSVFYTDVLGIAPALASMLLLIAKISDGIFDPIFGSIAERTRTKFGRFRPYIIFGAPVLAVFSSLCFTQVGTGTVSAIFAFIIYVFCGFAYTVVNLSYGSLSTVMTTDPNEVAQLNSYRMIGTNLSAVILNAITPGLLVFFSGSDQYTATSYMWVAIFFALCSLPLFYFTAWKCKERIQPINISAKVPLKETVNSVVRNKPLLLIFLIQLLAMTAFFGRMGIVIYYLMYNVQTFNLIALFMSLPSLATVVGIFFTKNYIVKIGKKKMAAIGYIGAAISLILMFIVGEFMGYNHVNLLLILTVLYGFFCFSFPIPMAMVNDAINYSEDKFGVRSDGTSYATVSLSTKLGSAFGVSLGIMVMGMTGYIANTQQTPEALTGINFSTNLMMALLYLLCLIPLFKYPLNEKVSAEILDKLTAKRESIHAGGNVSPANIYNNNTALFTNNMKALQILKNEKVVKITAMTTGLLLPLSEVKDPIFAKGLLGSGFAIIPENGDVFAPVSGTIITVFQSKHAIGIQSEEGLEILIHMGTDTYALEGKPFTILVEEGEQVKAGQQIAKIDLNQLTEANKGKEILFFITNHRNAKRIVIDQVDSVQAGNSIGIVVI